jgi:hypothetical protein
MRYALQNSTNGTTTFQLSLTSSAFSAKETSGTITQSTFAGLMSLAGAA